MAKDLTNSVLDRQNILNNSYALNEIEKATELKGVIFQGEIKFSKTQVARFFEIDERTIERYIEKYNQELVNNGYEVLRGNLLQNFKLAVKKVKVADINVGNTRQFAVFNFRAFLNMAMLLVESEKARSLRSVILDIVIDTINQKTGGGTKYINQRDENFVITFMRGEDYRREFTDALRDYVAMGTAKYAIYTNKIYNSIFKENANEYRQILKLHDKENVRETMYCEILNIIYSYETGFAEELKKEFEKKNRKLLPYEVDELFRKFENMALWRPQVEDARSKMASRDLGFRDAMHHKLEEYIRAIPREDFERFLGEKSKAFEEQLKAASDVLRRLKESGE